MINYNTKDQPTEMGVYACRVESDIQGWYDDEFLFWQSGRWGYISSDQRYRGKVLGWIGPLQRRMPAPEGEIKSLPPHQTEQWKAVPFSTTPAPEGERE